MGLPGGGMAVFVISVGMFVKSASITNRMIQTASNRRPSQTDDRGRTKKTGANQGGTGLVTEGSTQS